MMKFLLTTLLAIAASSATLVSATLPAAGDVVINEVFANGAQEWVELYNTKNIALDIGGLAIDDILTGGAAPDILPAGASIPAFGFYAHDMSGLNNGGDTVNLLHIDGVTLLDSFTYTASTADESWARVPDGAAWSLVSIPAPTKAASNVPVVPETPWVPGTFDVRVLDVEHGASNLIIFPSGYTVLYDAGEVSWNGSTNSAKIAQKILDITGGATVDVGVFGHYHADHVGYVGIGGFWGLMHTHGITFGKIVHQDVGTWNDVNNDGVCDEATEIVYHNAGTMSGTADKWICYFSDPASTYASLFELAVLGSTTQIAPGGADESVTVVLTDAAGVKLVDGVTPMDSDLTGMASPPSTNGYSVVLKVVYKDISIVFGGDIDGEYATSAFQYTYNDAETVAAPLIGEVEMVLANHHGSGHSNHEAWVSTLHPRVALFSCGENSFGHPAQDVIDRFTTWGAQSYYTNTCDTTRDYGAGVVTNYDLHVLSSDGVTYTVNGDAYNTADAKTGGSGGDDRLLLVLNEIMPRGNEWVELANPTGADIDASGMWIDDILGQGSGKGSAPKELPAGSIVPANGYLAWDLPSNILNNGGDPCLLLMPDKTTIVDSTTYSSSSTNKSCRRSPDVTGAFNTACSCAVTKGAANTGSC